MKVTRRRRQRIDWLEGCVNQIYLKIEHIEAKLKLIQQRQSLEDKKAELDKNTARD